jgi:hypothetical protein
MMIRHNTLNISLATFLAAGMVGGPIAADFAAATVETGRLFGVGGRLIHIAVPGVGCRGRLGR